MKEFTCIICPRGCRLIVENDRRDISVTGNYCRRGYKYALQEYTNPERTVTLNIRVAGGVYPVVPVKTSGTVALPEVMPLVLSVKKLTVQAPIKAGDVLFLSHTGAELVATKSIDKAVT